MLSCQFSTVNCPSGTGSKVDLMQPMAGRHVLDSGPVALSKPTQLQTTENSMQSTCPSNQEGHTLAHGTQCCIGNLGAVSACLLVSTSVFPDEITQDSPW